MHILHATLQLALCGSGGGGGGGGVVHGAWYMVPLGVVCMRWQCARVVLYSITGAQHLCI